MSTQNVALAHEVIDAVERRDLSRLIDLTDPEVEWRSVFAELGEGGLYRGHAGMRRYVKDISDAWEIVRLDVDDELAVADVAVLVGRIHYRGKGSGVEAESPAGYMLKFHQGRVICFRAFREPERALEAVGLSE
jgi:ketosteroid isomerase-like protein